MRSATDGFWAARSAEFYGEPLIQRLLWLRIAPDAVFIALGVVPLVIGLVRAWRSMRPVTPIEPGNPVPRVQRSRFSPSESLVEAGSAREE
jgi:hypothetical protein